VGDESAVRLPERPYAWIGHKAMQDYYFWSLDESVAAAARIICARRILEWKYRKRTINRLNKEQGCQKITGDNRDEPTRAVGRRREVWSGQAPLNPALFWDSISSPFAKEDLR
jgi:hypothetical protein